MSEHDKVVDTSSEASTRDGSLNHSFSNEASTLHNHEKGQSNAEIPAAVAGPKGASWKDDLRIIPTLAIMFTLLNLDRTSVKYSNEDTVDLLGTENGTSKVYQGIFYLGFIIFVFPSILLQRRLGARIVLPSLMVGWGAMTMIQAAVSSWAGLAAVQFFLGSFQAGFFAGVLAYVANIWKPHQLGFRLALIFGFGMVLASFNRCLVVAANNHNSTSLASWKLLAVAEGAVTVGLSPLGFLLPRSDAEAASSDASDSSLLKVLVQPTNVAFAFLALLLGICAKCCQTLIYQEMWSLQSGDGMEAVLNVAAYTTGFVILLLVALSSDFYRERSTHVAVPVLATLAALVNIILAFYINKRPPSEYDSFCLATTVFIAPVLYAWSMNKINGNAARVWMAAFVVTGYQIGELVGWLIFMNAKLTFSSPSKDGTSKTGSSSSSSSSSGSAHKKRTVSGNDADWMEITSGFMAAFVVFSFALGAWQKRGTRTYSFN